MLNVKACNGCSYPKSYCCADHAIMSENYCLFRTYIEDCLLDLFDKSLIGAMERRGADENQGCDVKNFSAGRVKRA